ncbi:50S ribosomal protein L15 [Candidatus Endowatersipora endosymbiont of Watersipora subatra]|uniref:50S ribosomal protein L15 n=1 Tax=Candidatus Endowatersipora endosymbiont of Watersipora subatra TaxID=3077946 RepID=UPI00312CABD8
MKLNEISDKDGSVRSSQRLGRGIGSGCGKTAGRGVKGQKSRSGVSINGFEGGQMPIYRRLPKRGFSNAFFKKDYNEVSISCLEKGVQFGKLDVTKPITAQTLLKVRIIRRIRDGVRILGGSEAQSKFYLEVSGSSKSALDSIKKAGGAVKIVEG